jgi:hypothetical protein
MLKRFGSHLRSNAVAYVALFVALGGVGAYAADKIGSGDIKKNAVRSKHVKNEGLKIADLASSARGIRNPEIVFEESSEQGGEESKFVGVDCPGNKLAISGGALMDGADGNVYITESTPQSGGSGPLQSNWNILAQEEGGNDGGSNWSIHGFAVCVKVG